MQTCCHLLNPVKVYEGLHNTSEMLKYWLIQILPWMKCMWLALSRTRCASDCPIGPAPLVTNRTVSKCLLITVGCAPRNWISGGTIYRTVACKIKTWVKQFIFSSGCDTSEIHFVAAVEKCTPAHERRSKTEENLNSLKKCYWKFWRRWNPVWDVSAWRDNHVKL